MPGATSSGMPRVSHTKFRDETVWGVWKSLVGTGHAGSVFGENWFYRRTRGTSQWGGGGRHMIKLSSEPWVAYPEVKVQVRDLVRVVGIVAPFVPMGGQYSGIICLSSPRGYMGTGDLCRVPHPPAVRHGRARQSSGTGPCGDCRKIPCVPGPGGQCSGKIHRETQGTRLGGRHVAKRT